MYFLFKTEKQTQPNPKNPLLWLDKNLQKVGKKFCVEG